MVLFVVFIVLMPHILGWLTAYWWSLLPGYSGSRFFIHFAGGLALVYLTVNLFPWCYSSIYFPYLYGAVWLIIVGKATFFQHHTHKTTSLSWRKVLGVGFLLVLSIGHFWMQQPPPATVNWPVPLRGKGYYVQQGGHSWLTNPFHHRYYAQQQAMDIVQLNRWGNRASCLLPQALNHYCIYGDTVYSPIAGTIIRSVNNRPEPTPPNMDASLPLGNHVMIQTGDTIVILGHMIPGSVLHHKGDRIAVGTPVGLVGNSGRSSEPHLHYQAILQTSHGWAPLGIRWRGAYPSTGDRLAD